MHLGFVQHYPITKSSFHSPANRSTHTLPKYTRAVSFAMSAANDKKGILMLCLGNICRSPAAEAVMNGVLDKRNLADKYFVDSCGTGGGNPDWYIDGGFSHHVGDPADSRMRAAATKRGLNLESRSRPLNKEDFDKFEYIVGMDSSNLESIETARKYWQVDDPKAKVVLMSQFSPDEDFRGKAVPDPYWSGPDGFEYALDLIQGACDGLADHIKSNDASQ